MEQMFLELFKISPIVGFMAIIWFYQRKDYTKLVEDTRSENREREDKMQCSISKNQDIITELATQFNVIKDVKEDVEQIKEYIFK